MVKTEANNPTTNHIVILGGGYAGIMAALRLAGKTKRQSTTVTLVNALEHFVERPRLHEQAAGTTLQSKAISHMLRGTKAQFIQGRVQAVDPIQQTVTVERSEKIEHLAYNYLVYALGSQVDRQSVPGVDSHAYTLDPYGTLTTDALGAKLAECHEQPCRIAVVGGGATGVEAATQIKAMLPNCDVCIISNGEVGAFKGARVQKHIQQALAEQSIALYEHTPVVAVESNGVVTESNPIAAEIIIWAGGFRASAIARDAGIQVNERNQIMVDSYLRSLSHPTLYAVGDAACPLEEPGVPIRMSLFTALVSGAQAADNIVATIRHKRLYPLSFVWYGQGIALGPHDAVGFPTYPADAAVGPIFRRMLAVRVRNFFVWYLGTVLEMERRLGRGRKIRQSQKGVARKHTGVAKWNPIARYILARIWIARWRGLCRMFQQMDERSLPGDEWRSGGNRRQAVETFP
ncbi:FAD-dependent oxidoreductase [Chloroflexi bacterium TSY]|nr:FAD-dependent oxidoreductase [Chloroflexi bacterium TSY]